MTSVSDDHSSDDHPDRPAVRAARAVRAVPRPNAVVGVGLIVVGADGRILLGQAHDGRWELPGGKVDPGEGFEQAAARELAEETDLRVAPEAVEVFTVQLAPGSNTVTRLTAGAVTHAAEGRPAVTEPDKIARWEWFGPAGLPPELYAPSAAVLRAWRPELAGLPEAPSYDYRTDGAT
ncbi:nucleotide triphosphate diphosphatase NUDT15 [Streptomyces goshikiensis]